MKGNRFYQDGRRHSEFGLVFIYTEMLEGSKILLEITLFADSFQRMHFNLKRHIHTFAHLKRPLKVF